MAHAVIQICTYMKLYLRIYLYFSEDNSIYNENIDHQYELFFKEEIFRDKYLRLVNPGLFGTQFGLTELLKHKTMETFSNTRRRSGIQEPGRF